MSESTLHVFRRVADVDLKRGICTCGHGAELHTSLGCMHGGLVDPCSCNGFLRSRITVSLDFYAPMKRYIATLDDDHEPGMPMGDGATEEEAIEWLLDYLDSRDELNRLEARP